MYNFIKYIYTNTKQRKTLSKLNSSLYSLLIILESPSVENLLKIYGGDFIKPGNPGTRARTYQIPIGFQQA